VSEDLYVGSNWLTPGNFGPDQADDSMPPAMYFVIVVVLSVFIIGMHQFQIVADSQVDAGLTSPNDFAALVKGLPTTATDERAIMSFFEENALRGRRAEIVKVVIGWDASAFREKITKIRELKKQLQALAPDDEQVPEIKKEIVEINRILASAAPDVAARLNSSGTVVVIFRHQEDLRASLDRWQGFWARWSYADADNNACLSCFPGIMKGPPLPCFQGCKLWVERAPNPGDINWLQFTATDDNTNFKMKMKTTGIMTVLVIVAFFITWGLNLLQEKMDEDGSSSALSLLPALGLAFANMVLMVASRKLSDREYHDTKTEKEFSTALKMTFACLVNTGGVVLFINAKPKEWYKKGGLIDDLFYVLMVDALVPPLIFFIDVKYYLTWFLKRRKLTESTM